MNPVRIRALFIATALFGTMAVDNVSGQQVVRGPYLQIGTPTSVVVRWRTDQPTDSRIRFGEAPGNLSSRFDDATITAEHIVNLQGLQPATKYYYSIGNSSQTLAGDDSAHFFVTSPLPGTRQATRVWVIGDAGTQNDNQRAVRDAYYEFAADRHTNLWLMLGDNAYDDGTDKDYQLAVFENMYETLLRKSVLWPTRGNHDRSSTNGELVYYNIFSLPTQAEAGGLASGTEAYYSFDFANIHFVCLESVDKDLRATGSPMWTWLEADLSANTQDWIIAFWHHPPYSKGSHNSDKESQLIEMRERALPILEDYGVDLVLAGHSHSYERSYFLDGHYGTSNTLSDTMLLDRGNGRDDGDGAYQKALASGGSHDGAVYIVAGSSGKASGGSLDHPVMFTSLRELGSLVLDVEGGRLDAKFLDDKGEIRDYFGIVKELEAPDPVMSLVMASGNDQNAPAGTTLPELLVVEVREENGTPVAGVDVAFAVTSGGGSLSITQQSTGSDGRAATQLTLGSRPGTNTVVASSKDLNGSPLTFTATGTWLPPEVPTAPQNLVAVSSLADIELRWVDNSNNETGFSIERRESENQFSEIVRVQADISEFRDVEVRAGATYHYRIAAFNEAGKSAYSNEATVTVAAPENYGPNLALRAFAAASSFNHEDEMPNNAIDGNSNTIWRSAILDSANQSEWLQVDLGEPLIFGRVVVNWSSPFYALRYDLQVSGDGSAWINLYNKAQSNGDPQDIVFPDVMARFVRLNLTETNGASFGVSELEIYSRLTTSVDTSDDDTPAGVPSLISLKQNYPNPFNPSTDLAYAIAQPGNLRLEVLNSAGQLVAILAEGYHPAGEYTVTFNASSLPSGAYLAVLTAGNQQRVRRLLYLK